LRVLIIQIERRDSDLSRQHRRAAASIALNWAKACTRRARIAKRAITPRYCSARETLSCLEVAQALGYVAALDAAVDAKLRLVGSG
jgi:four helix bundle protein